MGTDIQRKESIRGRIAHPKCQSQYHQRRITLWTRNRTKAFFLAQWSAQKEPYLRSKVEMYSCFFIVQRRISDNSDLQNGHKIGAPLRPGRKTFWGSSSLGHDKAEIVESVRWLRFVHEGSSKTIFEYCEGSKNSLAYFRAIQGHTGNVTVAPELMAHDMTPYGWTGVVPSTSTPSLRTDSLLEENRARRDDKPSSFRSSTLSVKSWWRSTQCWLRNAQARALSQQLETWSSRLLGKIVPSTRSRIAILANEIKCSNRTQFCAGKLHLPSNFSERRSNIIRRLSTPRFAPKVTLASNWHSQQQQPLSGDVPSSSRKPVAVEIGNRDVQGYTMDDQTSSGKPVRNSVSFVDKKPKFEIDLRVEGVSQDAILKDEQKKEINKQLEKLKMDHAENPFVTNWRKREI